MFICGFSYSVRVRWNTLRGKASVWGLFVVIIVVLFSEAKLFSSFYCRVNKLNLALGSFLLHGFFAILAALLGRTSLPPLCASLRLPWCVLSQKSHGRRPLYPGVGGCLSQSRSVVVPLSSPGWENNAEIWPEKTAISCLPALGARPSLCRVFCAPV